MAVKMAVVKNLVAVKGLQVAVNLGEGGSEGLPRSGNPVVCWLQLLYYVWGKGGGRLEKWPYLADKCRASRNNYKLGPFLTTTPRCLGFLVFHILCIHPSPRAPLPLPLDRLQTSCVPFAILSAVVS
jgi:hypothetical protein